MKRGNSSNCVHWLYEVDTGTLTSTLLSILCVIALPPFLRGRIWNSSQQPVDQREDEDEPEETAGQHLCADAGHDCFAETHGPGVASREPDSTRLRQSSSRGVR